MSIEKKILLLGSGFVAFPCLNHLLKRPENRITVACRHLETSRKMAIDPRVTPIQLDIANAADLDTQVAAHDIVISLVPYLLHTVVIKACIKHKKNIVTTSYVSADMAKLHDSCVDAQITCFNEIGVDPGIDHLYAIKMIDHVHKNNGKITSFLSYCGGLPAPECSNNPLGYKFSWSSRGVLLALRNDAKYLENGQVKQVSGVELMDTAKPIYIYPAFAFLGYPNRDSTPYTTRYNIPECRDLIRGTLRYQGFPQFVKVLVQLGFLSDAPMDHLQANAAPIQWKSLLAQLLNTTDTSEQNLVAKVIEKAKIPAQDQQRIISGLRWLGLFSSNLVDLKGTLLDCLCATMDAKMQYEKGERDMVMLQHRFEIEYADGRHETRTSTGLWFGKEGESAMARTVGVPCGITVQLILDGAITEKGVLAPMTMELCMPLIEALEKEGISMTEAIV